MATRYPGDKKPSYQCHEFFKEAMAGLREPCGRIVAATLDDLVAWRSAEAQPAALELSLRASEDLERERQRLHEQWRLRLERASQDTARAERQYQLAEPENRLVARTLEARWEEALQRQRQETEEYERFLAKLPMSLSVASGTIQLLGEYRATLNDAGTSVVDRRDPMRRETSARHCGR
jgi:exonuclease VII large subunit